MGPTEIEYTAQTEIGDFDGAMCVDEDVTRLEITVHDGTQVKIVHALGDRIATLSAMPVRKGMHVLCLTIAISVAMRKKSIGAFLERIMSVSVPPCINSKTVVVERAVEQ
jgi:hypothetical protein